MGANPGITFKVGNKTHSTAATAFGGLRSRLTALSTQLGDLTRPFDEISAVILPDIKHRFDTGELADPPYRPGNSVRSRFTKNARRARGFDPNGPTGKASGNLQRAVQRMPGPTKSESGGQREVHRLTFGVNASAAPYYRDFINGGIWEVPVRLGTRGGMHFDPDRLPGATMSSSTYWGPKRWAQYAKLPEGFKRVEVPPTNIFHLSSDDNSVIRNIILDWIWRAGIKI